MGIADDLLTAVLSAWMLGMIIAVGSCVIRYGVIGGVSDCEEYYPCIYGWLCFVRCCRRQRRAHGRSHPQATRGLRLVGSKRSLPGSPSQRAEAFFGDNAVVSSTLGHSQEQMGEVQERDEEQLGSAEGQHSPGSHSHQNMSGSSSSPRRATHSALSQHRVLRREDCPSTVHLSPRRELPPVGDVDEIPIADVSLEHGSVGSGYFDVDYASSRLGCGCFHRRSMSTPSPEVCAICLVEMSACEALDVLEVCGHVFHSCCIDEWLYVSNFCPLCRRQISGLMPSLELLQLPVLVDTAASVAGAGNSDDNPHDITIIHYEG
eukprot:gnl/TRDRNA2_/TRDRNA2_176006_c0_seq1.p1 gnl/TRDRNA2_/TRDRNA2_176006_c0~~gnl/TRDRNA2_/TRDRNA2_176006_c0_seq1.p1  ORF type:complete len:340 (+),score=18.65 gnl/TRDRNA2_/TRDRNA2_176006_c0_seq1:64-1020(+)